MTCATKHYDWRPDVRRLVRRFLRRHDASANTYVDHPTGWHLDDVSVDFWNIAGCGVDLPLVEATSIFRHLMARTQPPHFRWIIHQGRIYYPNGTDYPYWDPNDMHYDHVHVTFW